MNETLFLELVQKLEGFGVDVGEYRELVERFRDIMADSVSLAGRLAAVRVGGTDPLTVDQLVIEIGVCQKRMLELLASVETHANEDTQVVLRALLAEGLAVVLKAIA